MSSRGYFICLEGIDGAGTTSQAQAVATILKTRGINVHVTAEPSKGMIGALARKGIHSEIKFRHFNDEILALLFAADRLHHLAEEIIDKLDKGIHVITDRYLMSSLVYQGSILDVDWVKSINSFAVQPDITILLDVPAEVCEQRRLQRDEAEGMFDSLATQKKFRESYRALAQEHNAFVVDGNKAFDDVTAEIVEIVGL